MAWSGLLGRSLVVCSLLLGASMAACGGEEASEPSGGTAARNGSGGDDGGDGGRGAGSGVGGASTNGGQGVGGASDGGAPGMGGAGGTDPDVERIPARICFLNNCVTDAECTDCTFGRNTCDKANTRCVACVPGEEGACDAGKECTSFGICGPALPPGTTSDDACPTDSGGEPTKTCTSNDDCAWCDGDHQVCDTEAGRCVSCVADDESACRANEFCGGGGDCEERCPEVCDTDADCTRCGEDAEIPTTRCREFALATGKTKRCAQCATDAHCGDNEKCTAQGVCAKICGLLDWPQGTGTDGKPPKGACETDADCAGCGDGATRCVRALNGGVGRCGLEGTGCLGLTAGDVLPEPWDQLTNFCSNDGETANPCPDQGVNFNVGKALRDVTGLDLFKDANVQYSMSACATVDMFVPDSVGSTLGSVVQCGLCVPCLKDSDCKPINVSGIVEDLLGPLGGLVARWALEQVFGTTDASGVQIPMRCEQVAAEAGVCVPCFDPSKGCAVNTTSEGCTTSWDCGPGEYCDEEGTCEEINTDSPCLSWGCGSAKVCTFPRTGTGDLCCREPAPELNDTCGQSNACPSNSVCIPDINGVFRCAPEVTDSQCTDR